MKDRIVKDIIETFRVSEIQYPNIHRKNPNSTMNAKYYVDSETYQTAHLILAKEESEAGIHYNETSHMILLEAIASGQEYQLFNLEQGLLKYMQSEIPNYYKFNSQVKSTMKIHITEKLNASSEIYDDKSQDSIFDIRNINMSVDKNGLRLKSLVEDDFDSFKKYIGCNDNSSKFEELEDFFIWIIKEPRLQSDSIEPSKIISLDDCKGFYFIIDGLRIEDSLISNPSINYEIQVKEAHYITPIIQPNKKIREFGSITKELKDDILTIKWKRLKDIDDEN